MLTINTNLSSLIVQSNLKQSTNGLNRAIERMTTGFKINGAKDNAANYGIAAQMSTKISAYEVAEDNVAMGLDLLAVASDSLSLINDHLSRVRDLTEQSLNGTYGSDSLKAINAEIKARTDEINRIISNTEYNGIHLFGEQQVLNLPDEGTGQVNQNGQSMLSSLNSGTEKLSSGWQINRAPEDAVTTVTINFQVGIGSSESDQVSVSTQLDSVFYAILSKIENSVVDNSSSFKDTDSADEMTNMKRSRAVIGGNNPPQIGLGSATVVNNPLEIIDRGLSIISAKQTELGAVQNRLESALEEINTHYENLVSSRSTLRDADITEESSAYIRNQILQQASATLLATANQSPSIALQLL